MNKFTEGEWELRETSAALEIHPIGVDDMVPIAEFELGFCEEFDNKVRANAALMLASKDMYEALEESTSSLLAILSEYRHLMSQPFINGIEVEIKNNRAALAKARGES